MKTLHLHAIILIVVFVAIFAIGGQGDYEAALMAEQDYCQRVADGIHTNYDRIDCSKWGEQ